MEHLTAKQISARRRPLDARHRLKQRMAVDWVKIHQPDVWEAIVEFVDERGSK